MDSDPNEKQIKVVLKGKKKKTKGPRDALRVELQNCPSGFLEISFRRTVRIPDNENDFDLTPDCGNFPIYSVKEFEATLPAEIIAKGGCFVPIYQREAMWINFEAGRPFAIKVLVGGVNAISGESSNENMATLLRRNKQLSRGDVVQDYLVPPNHIWLDGVATQDGRVRQFVATPLGSGYSVEAQMTGGDSVGGLQFEIVPLKLERESSNKEFILLTFRPSFKGHEEKSFFIRPSVPFKDLVVDYCEREKLDSQKIRFSFEGNRILYDTDDSCEELGLQDGDMISVTAEQRGGGRGLKPKGIPEIALAPGGLIKQTIVKDEYPAEAWDAENTVFFNVQLVNAALFKDYTGLNTPRTPISASTYKKLGLPFYELFKEPSGIFGDFKGLKSVAELDKENEKSLDIHKEEKNLQFQVVPLAGMKRSFVPVSAMEQRLKRLRIANDL